MQPARPRPRRRSWFAPGALLLVVASVAVSGGVGWAQTAGRLITNADRFASRLREDGVRMIELIGNATLTGEDLYVEGDYGRLYSEIDELSVRGNVHLRTDSLRLWCDSLHVWQRRSEGRAFGQVRIETEDGARGFGRRAIYFRDRHWLTLIGNARVIQGEQVVAGDSIVIDRPRGTLESFGDVVVIDTENDATVRGRHALFDQATGLGVVDSLPVLRMRDGDGPLTTVEADSMAFHRETGEKTAIGNVDFRQGETRAHADTARILVDDLLVLTGAPTVEQQGRVMAGREIRIWSDGGKVRHVEVYDGASLSDSSPDTLDLEFTDIPLANTLTGDTLEIDFEEGEIARTWVRGSAHSVYLPEDQTSVVSVNDVRGESIDIRFREGQVDLVDVRGDVNGTYRFFERGSAPLDSAAADSLAALDSLATLTPDGGAVDSLVVAPPDSAAADSLGGRIDFATTAQTVQYTGAFTRFDLPRRRIDVSGDAVVEHGTLRLLADDIRFDTDAKELLAEDEDSVRLIDTESELLGARMGYLFDPQTGTVRGGATRFADGFYEGENIRRIDKKTMLIERGTYTSCDLAEPHYHFKARKMKLKVGENVVARQVTMHVSDIPVMMLPFYYKDLKKGRRSGIVFPDINIGVSSRRGRYVRDLGWYWATNDYTDFTFKVDYYERREAAFKIRNVYVKRYAFDGGVDFQYLRAFGQTLRGDEWRFRSRHRQPELWDFWRLNAEFDISSNNLTQENLGSNPNHDELPGRLYSTVGLNRTFDNGSSLNFSFARTQFVGAEDDDPVDNERTLELQVPVGLTFKSGTLVGGPKRSTSNPVANFFRDFNYSHRYGGSYRQQRNEASSLDALNANLAWGLSWNPEKVGPLVVDSSVSFTDNWTYTNFEKTGYRYETVEIDSVTMETEQIIVRDPTLDEFVDDSDNVVQLTISNGVATDIYGIFEPRIGALRAIKHKINLRSAWNVTPEIRGQQDHGQSFSFSVGQDISLKVADGGGDGREERGRGGRDEAEVVDGEEVEESTRKLEGFIRWNLATSLNPDAEPGFQWRPIRSDVTLRPGITDAIDFSANQVIDPYTFEVTSARFNSRLRLRGGLDLGGRVRVREEPKNPLLEQLPPAEIDSTAVGEIPEDDPRYEELQRRKDREAWLDSGDANRIPWELGLGGSFIREGTGDAARTRATLDVSSGLSLPGSWKFTYRANFDAQVGEFTTQRWTLSRPLHCWRLEFSRGITDGEDFSLRLYLADIPDLQIRRGDTSGASGFGGGFGGY